MHFRKFIFISLITIFISMAAVSAADMNNASVTDSSHLNDDSLAVEKTIPDADIHKACEVADLENNTADLKDASLSSDVASPDGAADTSGDLYKKSVCAENSHNESADFDQLNVVSLNKDAVNFYVNNSKELKNIFEFMSKNNPSWNFINIVLAPNTVFKVNYNTYSDAQFKYALRLPGSTMIIQGSGGSVIEGDKQKNNFAYVAPNARLTLANLELKSFNHCFINVGDVYNVNSIFSNNKFEYAKKKKNDYRKDIYGAVIANYHNAWFENCTFINNVGKYDKGGCWGSVLHGVSNSLTYFDRCTFKNCGGSTVNPFQYCYGKTYSGNFIYAQDHSTVVIIQDHELDALFKNCYFDYTSCLCAISTDVLNNEAAPVGVINCSNVEQLKEALYTVNSLVPNSKVVINLEPGEYVISQKWIGNNGVNAPNSGYFTGSYNNPRSLDWRNEKHHPSVIYKDIKGYDGSSKYALDVGVVPITINGNGATIKLSGNDGTYYHFAEVAYGGVLTVNNVTFSKFNHVFENYGTIYINDCVFKDNYDHGGKIILEGSGSSNHFSNCIFKQCKKMDDYYDALFKIEDDSYLKLEDCDFTDFFKTNNKIGSVKSSSVEAPSYLKKNIKLDKDSIFYNCDNYRVNETLSIEHGGTIQFDIVSPNYYANLSDAIKKLSPNAIFMNFTVDGELDLNKIGFNGNIIVDANNHDVRLKSSKIGKYLSLTIANLTFSNYKDVIFNIDGSLNLYNCNFINNKEKYIFDNKGTCNIVGCNFTGNVNSNNVVNNNHGFLSLDGCKFENCTCNDVLFYNCGGNIAVSNLNLTNNKIKNDRIVCNYQTSNCQIFNTSSVKSEFKQAKVMPTWKKVAIRAGIGIGVTALSFVGGYFIGYFATAFLHPAISVILGGVYGAGVGIAGGFLDDYIIGGYEHDHSNKLAVISIYASVGALSGAVGAGIGAQKYLSNHAGVSLDGGRVKYTEKEVNSLGFEVTKVSIEDPNSAMNPVLRSDIGVMHIFGGNPQPSKTGTLLKHCFIKLIV